MLRQASVIVLAFIGLIGCHREPKAVAAADTANTNTIASGAATGSATNPAPPLLLSAEDILIVGRDSETFGTTITGAVQPERRADLRAEISAVVLQVLKDNGDKVRQGDLIVRLDDTAIRDSLSSAEASSRAAQQAYDQALRQYDRLLKLRDAGMVSTQSLEDAEIRRNTTQSDVEAARARTVTARQQLNRTEVRAPFDGVVSDRKVSAGDTAQIGKELVQVIDPNSMRFEGMVSADHVGEVKAGQTVHFRIHGYADKEFVGQVARVNPATNVTTRQVEVRVNFVDNSGQSILAGLYTEGHIETGASTTINIPANVIVNEGEQAFAWKVSNNTLQKTRLSLGKRDERTGEFELLSGVADGDALLRHPNSKLIEGQKIEMTKPETTPSLAVAS